MGPQEILKREFLRVVDNQLRAGDPPETRQTLERLKQEGYTDEESRLLIAQCVAAEMMAVMETNLPFDEKRYAVCLHRLPESPA